MHVGKYFLYDKIFVRFRVNYKRNIGLSSISSALFNLTIPDPTFHLKKLADVQGIASTKVKYFALGAGNGGVACSLLDTAFVRGQWLIFQNLQLVPNIIVALQRRIDEAKDIHEDFRLWFTWEHTSLPQLQLLQRSIVIHCQPIRAIRYHTNTFVYSINESVFEDSSAKRHVMGCLVHLHRRWEWSADYAPFYWHAAFRMHSTNILSDMSHYAHSFSQSATEATGEQIHDRLTKFLASIYSHFITVCYPGPPRLARPPRPGPSLDFGFQYALIRNNRSQKIGLEY